MMVGYRLDVQHQVAGRIARRWGKDIKGRPPNGTRSDLGGA
jgi:hypothetical protein